MALTDTIQCDGVTTAFTLTRAVTTKESLSLTIASGDDAGLVVSPSDYTFSPVNSVSQSVTITWANAVNYGTVGVPVDVTVAIYHNPGVDPADTLLYSYDSASAMRPEMVGRDLEHIIDLVKMVIGGADLATTSLGDQEADIAALDVRLDAAEADINALEVDVADHETRIGLAETDIDNLQTTDVTHTAQLAGTTSSGLLTAINDLTGLLASAVAGTASTAADVLVADAGNYFAGANAETVLQEVALNSVKWVAGGMIDGVAGATSGDFIVGGYGGVETCKSGNVVLASGAATTTEAGTAYISTGEYRIYPPTLLTTADCIFSCGVLADSSAFLGASATGTYWRITTRAANSDPTDVTALWFTILKVID